MRSRATSASLQETVKMFGDVKELRYGNGLKKAKIILAIAGGPLFIVPFSPLICV